MFGNDAIVPVTIDELFPVVCSTPLPPIVAIFANVVHPVSVVFKVPVTIICPVCPGWRAPATRIVGVAETTVGSISLMTTPEMIALPELP